MHEAQPAPGGPVPESEGVNARSALALAVECAFVSSVLGVAVFVLVAWLPKHVPALSYWLDNGPTDFVSGVLQTLYAFLPLVGIGFGILYVFAPKLRLWLMPLCVVPLIVTIGVVPMQQYVSAGLGVFAAIPEWLAHVGSIVPEDPSPRFFAIVDLCICLLGFYAVGVGAVLFPLSMFEGVRKFAAAFALGFPVSLLLTPAYLRWSEISPHGELPSVGLLIIVVALVTTAVVVVVDVVASRRRSQPT